MKTEGRPVNRGGEPTDTPSRSAVLELARPFGMKNFNGKNSGEGKRNRLVERRELKKDEGVELLKL